MAETNHEKLVEAVRDAPSREWIDSYLDLAGRILSETSLSEDDPRLVMSLPRKGTIRISVNNRYVLTASRNCESCVEFILPPNQGATGTHLSKATDKVRFNSIYNEKESKRPWLAEFDQNPQQVVDDEFERLWLSAIKTEMKRAEQSPYRRYDKSVVYKAVQDSEYRTQVLQEAFE